MGEEEVIDKLASVMTVEDLAVMADEEGVSVRAVLRVLAEGLKADVVKVDNSGRENSRVADMATRHKYMTSALEVLRLVEKRVEVSGTIVHKMVPAEDVPRLIEIFEKTAELRRRRDMDRIQQGLGSIDVSYRTVS